MADHYAPIVQDARIRLTTDDLHSYRVKNVVEQFDARPAEIKALFSNSLDPVRAATRRDRMLAAGLPI
jgi:hypothetical protein